MAATVDVDKESDDCELKNAKLEDLFVNLTKASPKSSPAWNYFGYLFFEKPTIKIVASLQKRVFCKVCIEESKATVFFKDCNVKHFSASTSTTNLLHHIGNDHKISISSKSIAESTKSIQNYFGTERKVVAVNKTEKKFILIRDLVLLCCRDLLPFNLVDGPGLRDFLEKYKVAVIDELPNRTSISRALCSVYDDCQSWLVTHLEANCPDTVAITFDLWSCKYRRRSYITITLHYVNKVFELVNLTLSTSHFPDSHKGIHILPRVESILDSYGLSDKNINMVTDAGIDY